MLQGLYSGLSSLKANQIALDITSNNIANKDTLGYTKQRVNFSTNPIKDVNNASMIVKEGTGTHIHSVERIDDALLRDELIKSKEYYSNINEQYKSLNELDSILNEPQSDFSSMYDELFESLHRYTESPHNIELQYLAEQSAKSVKERFNKINNIFEDNMEKNNTRKQIINKELPSLIEQREYLEKEIQVQESANEFMIDKTYANDMRDKYDLLDEQIKIKQSEVKGINESNKNISNIQNVFINSFDKSYENINKYLNTNMTGNDANELLLKEKDIRTAWDRPFTELKNIKETSSTILGSSEIIMSSLQNKDDNISKVNIDEEMINMMNYQHAYEASAKVIQTYDEIMQTTLNLKR